MEKHIEVTSRTRPTTFAKGNHIDAFTGGNIEPFKRHSPVHTTGIWNCGNLI